MRTRIATGVPLIGDGLRVVRTGRERGFFRDDRALASGDGPEAGTEFR
ncbi:MAG TPA: hypothetical protein VJT09_02820 [Pyrinomonadaceae bacterium]|nr:hypothetical protein [Pyrinomonadaceae bacterium]